jgi:SAM-dependent methyltransferase
MPAETSADAVSGDPAADPEKGVNAAHFDAWNGEAGMHWVQYRDRHEAQLRAFTPHLLDAAPFAPDARILDVGCGCGATTLAAARQTARGHALGVDLSAPMLDEARRQAAEERIANASFLQADAQTHRFEPAQFDVAISRFGVMFFSDPAAAFANLGRALRPDGNLAFLCWQSQERNEFFTFSREAIAPHVTAPPLTTPGEPGPFGLADAAETRRLLEAAGFDRIEITGVAEPVWIGADPDDAIAYHQTTPANRAMYAAADDDARDRALSALRTALAARVTARGIELRAAAWLVTAHKAS